MGASDTTADTMHKMEAGAQRRPRIPTPSVTGKKPSQQYSTNTLAGEKNARLSNPRTKCPSREEHEISQALLSGAKSDLKRLSLLKELNLQGESEKLQAELKESLEVAKTTADGEAGESGKYTMAALTSEKRWLLFLAVMDIDDVQEPNLKMMEEFAVFLFKTRRQYRSREEKTGLGDSALLLARYTLAQRVFPKLYEAWQDLSVAELRERAKPFSAMLAETWIRLRRAFPEMQSSSKPFVKEKWPELAVFQRKMLSMRR